MTNPNPLQIDPKALKGLTKSLRFEVKDFEIKDAEKGLVVARFAKFNVKDHDGDWTLPGAFTDGAEVIISAYGHRSWSGQLPVGRGKLRSDEQYCYMDGQFFLDTQASKDTFATIKNLHDLQEWSYGFDILETGELTEQLRQVGVWRVLQKLHVYEVSPVLRGAGLETATLDVKARTEAGAETTNEPTDEERTDMRKQYERFVKTTHRLG